MTLASADILDTNSNGLQLIKRSEAFRANWYQDVVKVWTIGYGTTEGSMPGVSRTAIPGPITMHDAERLMMRSLVAIYEPEIEAHRLVLNRNQFSALVSFVYNIGGPQFNRSTMLKMLKAGDMIGAAGQFSRWVYAGGTKYRGLVTRRKAERELFETPPDGDYSRFDHLVCKLQPLEPLPVTPIPVELPDVPTHLTMPFSRPTVIH